MTSLSSVVSQLRDERTQVQGQLERLDQAISLLGNLNNGSRSTRGGTRNMSAASRKRIADAQKARWAKWHQQYGQNIGKLLRNVLSRLHPDTRWRLPRGAVGSPKKGRVAASLHNSGDCGAALEDVSTCLSNSASL